MSLSALSTTSYGELRSRLDRHGELQFVGDGLRVAGIPAKPRVVVEIGPAGPRPLFVSAGSETGPELPYQEVGPLATALVAAVRAWLAGPGTDAVVLESVAAQLRSAAARHNRLRLGAPVLGIAPAEAIPESYRVRWAWLLAEYARRTLDDSAAMERAVRLSGDWAGSADELIAAATQAAV